MSKIYGNELKERRGRPELVVTQEAIIQQLKGFESKVQLNKCVFCLAVVSLTHGLNPS